MGNIFCAVDRKTELNNHKRILKLEEENKKLRESLVADKKNITHIVKDFRREKIKKYVHKWYEDNKTDVDIGVMHFPILGNVDIFPDSLEKYIYEKMLLIVLTAIDEGLDVAAVTEKPKQ